MRKSHHTFGRVCLGVLAAGVLAGAFAIPGVALASSGSCGSSRQQCFTATVSSASTGAGATTTFTFEITNQSTRYPLNSVTLDAPTGIEITAVQGSGLESPATSATIGTPGSEHKPAPGGALSLAPGASISLSVTAILPCVSGSYNWTVTATNDGDNDSDDFALNAGASNLASAVTGSCSLAFVAQPASTAVNDTITSEFNSGDLGSAPVRVAVLSDTVPAEVVADSTAPVTVGIESNPGTPPGTLSGTRTENAGDGVASFSNLSINEAGQGYTLDATTTANGILGYPDVASATSADFTISDTIVICSKLPCTASVATTTTNGLISATSSSTGDYLAVGAGGISYSCGSYPLTSDPVSFDLLSAGGVAQSSARFKATLAISAAAVAASGHRAIWTWQICYASTVQFRALPHTGGKVSIGGVTYYTGLLPNCSRYQQAPCVLFRYKDRAGNVFITLLADGDPVIRS